MNNPTKPPIRGTKEWAVAAIDCCLGCPNNCRYCYGRYTFVVKRKLLDEEQWSKCTPIAEEVSRVHPRYSGQVMFPANHDIFPENIENCITVLRNLLSAGNSVLIVTKPRHECVCQLCDALADFKENVLFRFTITARKSSLLFLWEPGASSYAERMASLAHAKDKGFQTSVSVEPMLDTSDVVDMVHELLPFVTHSIWLGKMNQIEKRIERKSQEIIAAIKVIEDGQRDEILLEIYNKLESLPLLRWKESVKQVVGLELPKVAGLDE